MSFFKGAQQRIYPVGRLDYASEGLLLLPYFLGEKTPINNY